MAGIFAYIAFELYCVHFSAYGQTEPVRECWCTQMAQCNFSRVLGGPSNTNYNKENVALGKPVKFSSNFQTYTSNILKERAGCVAVNGNTGYNYYPFGDPKYPANCFHSSISDREPSWEVDLQTNYTITEITVYPRHTFKNRILNSTITVDNKFCYNISENLPSYNLPNYNPITIKCVTPLRGRFVRMKKDKWPSNLQWTSDYTLNLCEFQVWICKKGYFGEDCNEICDNCKECDNYYGTCIGDCQESYFGVDCNQRCLNCLESKCDRNGICSYGCDKNVTKDMCNDTVCRNGFYGDKCENGCPNCFEKKCDYHGTCLFGCANGWKGQKCNEACRSGYYGRGCTETCFTCLHKKCRVNGYCIAGCEEGWFGDTCTIAKYSEERPELDGSDRFSSISSALIVLFILSTSSIALLMVLWSRQSHDHTFRSLATSLLRIKKTEPPEEIYKNSDVTNKTSSIPQKEGHGFSFQGHNMKMRNGKTKYRNTVNERPEYISENEDDTSTSSIPQTERSDFSFQDHFMKMQNGERKYSNTLNDIILKPDKVSRESLSFVIEEIQSVSSSEVSSGASSSK